MDNGAFMETFFLRFPSRNDAKKCLHILAYCVVVVAVMGGEIKPR